MLSGHRRKRACELAGLETIRCEVVEMDRDSACIFMVDSNLQRTEILPSEKAFSYKMRLDAMNRQGKRTDLTSTPVESKLRTDEAIGNEVGESREQIRRYIRLTFLCKDLLKMVDEGRIALRPAVELSYLTVDEQNDLYETIGSEDATPSLAQAIEMKRLSQKKALSIDKIFSIMTQQKPNQIEKIKIPTQKLEKYFSRGTPQAQIESIILQALDEFYARRSK